MSETSVITVNVGKTIRTQLELYPDFILVSNKSPYDLQYSGYGTTGTEWIAAGLEIKLYKQSSANAGVLNLTAFNNAGISPANPGIVLLTQYIPGDTSPEGTWPVGIPTQIVSGNVTVTSLSQEGNAPPVETIDIGDNVFSKLWDIFNDGHATIAVDQSGVKHTVIAVNASGHPLQLGQSGDITDILGTLAIAGNTFFNGNLGVVANADVLNASGFDTFINSRGAGNTVHIGNAGTDVATFLSTGIHLITGSIFFIVGTLSRLGGNQTACGSGTVISHGLGIAPFMVTGTPNLAQPGSGTVGVGSIGSSTFTATVGAGSNISWTAMVG